MRSRDKMPITIFEKKPGEWWVRANVFMRGRPTNEIVPSFEDVFRLLGAIAHCETVKYTGKTPGGRHPVHFVRQFCKRALDMAQARQEWDDDMAFDEWPALAEELKIPLRETPDHWPSPDMNAPPDFVAREPDEAALARMVPAEKCRYLARIAEDKARLSALLAEYHPAALKSPAALDYFWACTHQEASCAS